MITSYFCYHYSDGAIRYHTPEESRRFCEENKVSVVVDGYVGAVEEICTSRPVKLADYSGFNPGMGINIRSNNHYREELKKRGLVEVGNEKVTPSVVKKKFYDDQTIKGIIDQGASLSGNEIAALKEGKKLHVD